MAAKNQIFVNFTFKFEGVSEETKKSYRKTVQDLGSNEFGTNRYTLMPEKYFLENINKSSTFYDIKYIQECITKRKALDIDLFKLKPKILRRPPCYVDKYVLRVDYARGLKFVKECFDEANSKFLHLCYNPLPMTVQPSIKAENVCDLNNTDNSNMPSLSPISTASSASKFCTSKSTLSSQSDSKTIVNGQDTCDTRIQNYGKTNCNNANIKMEVCSEVHNSCSILKKDADINSKKDSETLVNRRNTCDTRIQNDGKTICNNANIKKEVCSELHNNCSISITDPCECEEEQLRKEVMNKDTSNLQNYEREPAQSLNLPESMDTDAFLHNSLNENLVYSSDTEQSMWNKRGKIRSDKKDSPFHYTPSQNLISNPDDLEKSNNEKEDRINKKKSKNVRDSQIINSLETKIKEEAFQEMPSHIHNKVIEIDLTDTPDEVRANQVHGRKLNPSQKVNEGASTSSFNTNYQSQIKLQKRDIVQSNVENDESDLQLLKPTSNNTKLSKNNKRAATLLQYPVSKKLKIVHNSCDNENKGNSESEVQTSQNAKHSFTPIEWDPCEYDIKGTWLEVCPQGQKKCEIKNCPLSPEPHERHGVPDPSISILEKKIILRYLSSRRSINRGRGLEVWQEMVQEKYLNNRKWEGLRNHFKRYILKEFENYNLPEGIKAELRKIVENQTSKKLASQKPSIRRANGR